MYLFHIIYNAEAFCTLLLACVATAGDCLVQLSDLHVYKAVFDNSTHSLIGGLTWLIVSLKMKHRTALFRLKEVGLCALIAAMIDLDHFIMAKSLHLKDATSLQKRPPLHCSTVPIVVTCLLLIAAKCCSSEHVHHLAWIIFAAFSSHHIRDATRRGLWFYYFGTTSPIPYFLYVLITMTIPHIVVYLMNLTYIYPKTISDSVNLFVEEI